jgi:hypothetical protein
LCGGMFLWYYTVHPEGGIVTYAKILYKDCRETRSFINGEFRGAKPL